MTYSPLAGVRGQAAWVQALLQGSWDGLSLPVSLLQDALPHMGALPREELAFLLPQHSMPPLRCSPHSAVRSSYCVCVLLPSRPCSLGASGPPPGPNPGCVSLPPFLLLSKVQFRKPRTQQCLAHGWWSSMLPRRGERAGAARGGRGLYRTRG